MNVPRPVLPAIEGIRQGGVGDAPLVLWWAQRGLRFGAVRSRGASRLVQAVGAVIWWPMYPFLLVLQAVLMTRRRAAYYFSPDAVLTIVARRDGWHIKAHLTRQPGMGQGGRLISMLMPSLLNIADQNGVVLWMRAANEEMVRQYRQDVYPLEVVDTRWPGSLLLRRSPGGWGGIMSKNQESPVARRIRTWFYALSLPTASLLSACGLLLLAGFVIWLTGRPEGGRWYSWHIEPMAWKDRLTYAAAVATGIGALVALVVSYRKQRDAEEGKFATQFAAAAAQLGDSAPAVRIAGAYGVSASADRFPVRRQQCIDVLTGYLRLPYNPEASRNHLVESTVQRNAGVEAQTPRSQILALSGRPTVKSG